MYAVIETGGKQYRVELRSLLEVERLDAEQGATVTLDRVLLVADEAETAIGRPVVPDATVEAEVVRQTRGEKIDVFKYRPKARRRVKKGHRQELTVLRIADIRFNGRSAAELARQAEEAAKTERQRLEEAAARQAAADRELAARLAARRAQAAPAREATEPPGSSEAAGAAEATPAATPPAAASAPAEAST
ncbi:MAG TPA: 50S ribosomal protein L21, partial [Candidatus Binatia bacterium]|nr:50S ribosomal protein L21 [Candidatus Binatia bacterium]